MQLSSSDIAALADLARISLTEEELSRFSDQMGRILTYVQRLQEVPHEQKEDALRTHGVQVPLPDVLQDAGDVREAIIQNFPERFRDALKVPAIFSQPKG